MVVHYHRELQVYPIVTTSHLESFEKKSRNRLSELNEINSTNLIIRDQNSETEILENWSSKIRSISRLNNPCSISRKH